MKHHCFKILYYHPTTVLQIASQLIPLPPTVYPQLSLAHHHLALPEYQVTPIHLHISL